MSNYYNVSLKYCLDKPGVLIDQNKTSSLLKNINLSYYRELVKKEIVKEGMIPKLDNCFYALKNKVNNVSVGGHDIIKNNFTNITLD